MSIQKIFALGIAANELSKKITRSSKRSVGRTAVASGTGAVLGMAAAGTLAAGAVALGTATAPITVPLAVGSALVAGIASLFD
ncbi:hypothetical protein VT06_15795 [Arsukibacterium sp. MJ3]|uniref:hypothetical protein n=1 Tax=Arsukibacterium sp. MJ3 TaxID=1632859 RepID=UPI0006270906|nr:hypothetical protein [Arsukibacterium sp. MJ3]KKO47667.1 hypothetical protein VT06_15795 [Arsukibacterium sp. MJ3]